MEYKGSCHLTQTTRNTNQHTYSLHSVLRIKKSVRFLKTKTETLHYIK